MDLGTMPDAQARIATRKVDWALKYQKKHGNRTGQAPGLTEADHERLGVLAKRIDRALHMSGCARMDFRMRPDGSVFVLEANCNPSPSDGEDFAGSAARVGISYEALLHRIIGLGVGHGAEWRLNGG